MYNIGVVDICGGGIAIRIFDAMPNIRGDKYVLYAWSSGFTKNICFVI